MGDAKTGLWLFEELSSEEDGLMGNNLDTMTQNLLLNCLARGGGGRKKNGSAVGFDRSPGFKKRRNRALDPDDESDEGERASEPCDRRVRRRRRLTHGAASKRFYARKALEVFDSMKASSSSKNSEFIDGGGERKIDAWSFTSASLAASTLSDEKLGRKIMEVSERSERTLKQKVLKKVVTERTKVCQKM